MKLHKLILIGVVVMLLAALSVTALAAPDMRLNVGANAVVFRENGGIQVWTPDPEAIGGWSMTLSFTEEEALELEADLPELNTVVASEGGITLEILTNGQWQVLSGPDFEGKVEVAILESDFTFASQYTWSIVESAVV